jgi:hypothetical protein
MPALAAPLPARTRGDPGRAVRPWPARPARCTREARGLESMTTRGIHATVIRTVISAGIVSSTVLLAACGSGGMAGTGTAVAQTRHLAAFNSVDLAGSNNVTIHVGGKQSVVVRADSSLLHQVTTRVRAGTLVIGTTGSITTQGPMSVQISMPSLTSLTLSGSGIISAGNIQAQRLNVTLPGSGAVHASGTLTRLDVSLGGSGDAQLQQLVARDVHAVLSGSGRILVHPTNTLQASVSGSGAIMYSGHPAHVTRSITGSGAITGG